MGHGGRCITAHMSSPAARSSVASDPAFSRVTRAIAPVVPSTRDCKAPKNADRGSLSIPRTPPTPTGNTKCAFEPH